MLRVTCLNVLTAQLVNTFKTVAEDTPPYGIPSIAITRDAARMCVVFGGYTTMLRGPRYCEYIESESGGIDVFQSGSSDTHLFHCHDDNVLLAIEKDYNFRNETGNLVIYRWQVEQRNCRRLEAVKYVGSLEMSGFLSSHLLGPRWIAIRTFTLDGQDPLVRSSHHHKTGITHWAPSLGVFAVTEHIEQVSRIHSLVAFCSLPDGVVFIRDAELRRLDVDGRESLLGRIETHNSMVSHNYLVAMAMTDNKLLLIFEDGRFEFFQKH
jgi:hypothetical protein